MAEYKSIDDWIELGYRKQFLSPKAHLKQLENNTNIDQYVELAEQFAKKCSRKMFKFKRLLEECLGLSTKINFILGVFVDWEAFKRAVGDTLALGRLDTYFEFSQTFPDLGSPIVIVS